MRNRILILGAKGMLGHSLFRLVNNSYPQFKLSGTIRDNDISYYKESEQKNIIQNIDVLSAEVLTKVFEQVNPDIVINCIGIIKQLKESKDPILTLQLNALFPHQLLKICEKYNARLLCISTDCVFDGIKGNYTEDDNPNPADLYGKTKQLGEIDYSEKCFTIRTSMIGREINSKNGLLEWFLAQNDEVNGYTKAMYSGFTTLELSKIILEKIIPNEHLYGIMNVASLPISKYDLLKLVSVVYKKKIVIKPFDDFYCNRVLIAEKFNNITGYNPPSWREMIKNYCAYENISK